MTDKTYWLERLIIKPDNDDYVVTSPDFPELLTFGNTEEEARKHAADALDEAIAARIAHGEPMPEKKESQS